MSAKIRWDLKRVSTPKVLGNTAQGCRLAATLGRRCISFSTPKGLRSTEAAGRNPFRVETLVDHGPRVASQPWAVLHNAFGVI